VLIFKAELTPKEAEGAKAIAGAARKRDAITSFMIGFFLNVNARKL